MPDVRHGIRARLAVFSGSAFGGIYWGFLAMVVMAHERGGVDKPIISTPDLLIIIVVSVLTLLAGLGLLLASRTAARTLGVALMVCALSGWVAFGTVAIQSWLWRL